MHEQSLPHSVGLDIGTSTVRVIVGVPDPNDPAKPSIIGYGSSPNVGMRKGVVVHADDVAEAIVQAVTEAERLSGVPAGVAGHGFVLSPPAQLPGRGARRTVLAGCAGGC